MRGPGEGHTSGRGGRAGNNRLAAARFHAGGAVVCPALPWRAESYRLLAECDRALGRYRERRRVVRRAYAAQRMVVRDLDFMRA